MRKASQDGRSWSPLRGQGGTEPWGQNDYPGVPLFRNTKRSDPCSNTLVQRNIVRLVFASRFSPFTPRTRQARRASDSPGASKCDTDYCASSWAIHRRQPCLGLICSCCDSSGCLFAMLNSPRASLPALPRGIAEVVRRSCPRSGA